MSDDDPAATPAEPPAGPAPGAGVRQLRLVVTAEDYGAAVAFYRDALGLPELGAFADPDGRVVILDAGRATLEVTDEPHAAYIDRVEGVPDRPGGPSGTTTGTTTRTATGTSGEPTGTTAGTDRPAPRVRVAFEVTDAQGTTRRLEAAGARVVAEPVRTPWGSLNARLDAPADLEVTVFQELGGPDVPPPS